MIEYSRLGVGCDQPLGLTCEETDLPVPIAKLDRPAVVILVNGALEDLIGIASHERRLRMRARCSQGKDHRENAESEKHRASFSP
jgi:hypothetical protein